jgi:hypothetical protein
LETRPTIQWELYSLSPAPESSPFSNVAYNTPTVIPVEYFKAIYVHSRWEKRASKLPIVIISLNAEVIPLQQTTLTSLKNMASNCQRFTMENARSIHSLLGKTDHHQRKRKILSGWFRIHVCIACNMLRRSKTSPRIIA